MHSFADKSLPELMAMFAALNEELRTRKVVRSANNPTGDLAEYLFCRAFGWQQEPNSAKGFDATDENGIRYQIKARRIHSRNKSRQMSAIRDLEGFDVLAAVFDDDYRVLRAALVPIGIVSGNVRFSKHTNSNLFMLREQIWNEEGVVDVTERLKKVMS